MARYMPTWLTLIVWAFVNPRSYIGAQSSVYEQGLTMRVRKTVRLVALYVFGIVLYALPLTYAGIGITDVAGTPHPAAASLADSLEWDAGELWLFLTAFVENSVFLVAGSVLVFVVLHAAVVLLWTSKGMVQTVHTVVYATGVYLAAVYSLVWAVSIMDGVEVAEGVVLAVQSRFVTGVVDLVGADLQLLGATTTLPETSELTTTGALLLVALACACLYFLYSMYLGVRINHDGSRLTALGAVAVVLASPVVYVIGSVAFTLLINP